MMKIDSIVSKESILDRFAKLKKKLCSLNAGWGDTPPADRRLRTQGKLYPRCENSDPKNDESVHEQHGDFADLTKLDQQI